MKKINVVNDVTSLDQDFFNTLQDNVEEVFNGEEAMGSIVVDGVECSNIFDKSNVTGGWLDGTVNKFWNEFATTYGVSNYIPIKPLNDYLIMLGTTSNIGSAGYAFYDENKTFLSGSNYGGDVINVVVSSPANAKFIRFTFYQANIDTTQFKQSLGSTPIINDATLKLKEGNIIPITPDTGSNYDVYGNCYYYKIGTRVHLHLGLSGLTPDAGHAIFTLPSGFRPLNIVTAVGVGLGLNQNVAVQVGSTGGIYLYSPSTHALLDVEFDAFN